MGLRSMYFLLAGIVHQFVYLKYGLAVILIFVGVKMVIVDFYHFPVVASLAVIVVTLIMSILASLYLPAMYGDYDRRKGPPHGKTGSVFGHSHEEHEPHRLVQKD
jgi:predicted tellurium resistance membrane protein TerC